MGAGRAALSKAAIEDLRIQAGSSARRRMHLNVHQSYADLCQRFFNVVYADSYIPPHRHLGDHDEETIVAVEGRFVVILFEDDGSIRQVIKCGAGAPAFGAVIEVGTWHTVVALTNPVVMIEIKAGPFDPGRAKHFADWAPAEGAPEAAGYLTALRSAALSEERSTS